MVDLDARRSYETNLINVCQQRDFNRIDVPNERPDALEKVLGELEGRFATALQRVVETRSTCDDETWNQVLNLMSLLAARHPLVRAHAEQLKDAFLRQEAQEVLKSPETWAKHAQELVKAGYLTPEQAAHPYEEIKRFADDEQFTISFSPGHLPVMSLVAMQCEPCQFLGRLAGSILGIGWKTRLEAPLRHNETRPRVGT